MPENQVIDETRTAILSFSRE